MDWHDLVIARLSELGKLLHQPPRFFVYQHQCFELIRQLSTKFAKFWIFHHSGTGDFQIQSPDFEYLQHCPQALKEVHRVLKHALSFLQACTRENWLTTALYKADTNEALIVHIHDLLWCVVGLDVSLHKVKGNSMESCSELLARRVRDCNQELESLAGRNDILQQDVKQLLAELHSIVDEVKIDRGNFSSYMSWCLPPRKTKRLNSHQQIALHTIRTLVNGRFYKRCFNVNDNDKLQRLGYDLHDMRCFGVEHKDELGQGGFSRFFRASWLGLQVALSCPKSDWTTSDIYMSYLFRNPFVIRTLGTEDDFPHTQGGKKRTDGLAHGYVMELMSRDLAEEIRRRRPQTGMETEGPFPLAVAVDIMLQISRGVEYLHELGVLHRDIKPENILVEACEGKELYSGEGLVRLKICDFNISLQADSILSVLENPTWPPDTIHEPKDAWVTTTPKGTLFYIAPECLTTATCSFKADVYSFAITCSHILTGLTPYEGVQLKSAKMKQFILQLCERPTLPMNCPSILVGLICRCWDDDPSKRPNFRDISRFLTHVKLVLMRMDDPEDFMLSLTDFDLKVFEKHLNPSPLQPFEDKGYPVLSPASEGSASYSEGSVSKVEQEEVDDEKISEFLSSVKNYKSEDELSSMPNFIWRMSLKDLTTATNNFSRKNRLGIGGYAEVYKGVLTNGMEVAVKRLNAGIKVFGTEARASAKVTHPNVIRLLGLCDDDRIKLLVYDFMVHGSLAKVLFGATASSALNWKQRCKIALGIAHGLAYLHEDCESCILHFDVKAGNILLDRDLQPKLCDFGMSELVDHRSKTFISFGRRGTRGYMAPEFKQSLEEGKRITDSADVYSFGMLLFEIVRGQPNFQYGCREQWTPSKARIMLDEGRVAQMMDPYLLCLPHQETVRQQVEGVVRIALLCTCEESPESRPAMHSIVLWLTPFTH